jgi:hypothetical protein
VTTTIHPASSSSTWSGTTSTPAQVGADTRKAIGQWKTVPYQIVTSTFNIDLVASHPEGITQVEFAVNGGTYTAVTVPETEAYESEYTAYGKTYKRRRFRCAIDPADFNNALTAEVRAIITPVAGQPIVMQQDISVDYVRPGLILFCYKNGFTPTVVSATTAAEIESYCSGAGNLAEGGVIELAAGSYALPSSSNTVRANTLPIKIRPASGVTRSQITFSTSDLVSGYIDLKVKRLIIEDIGSDLTLIGQFKMGAGYRVWFAGPKWFSSDGWGKDTTGGNQKNQPISSDFSGDPSRVWVTDSANNRAYAYNSVYGFAVDYLWGADMEQISGSPMLGQPRLCHDVTLKRFNSDYIATSNPDASGSPYHRDVFHKYDAGDNYVIEFRLNSDTSGANRVEAQVFNCEAPRAGLGGALANGTISNLTFINILAPTAPVVNAVGGGGATPENNFGGPQYSEQSGTILNVSWDNLHMPNQAFVFSGLNVTPVNCEIKDASGNWQNYLNYNLGSNPPSGVTLTNFTIGGQSTRAVQNFTARSGVSGVALSWDANPWPEADSMTLYKATGSGAMSALTTLSTSATTYTDTSVSDGTTYHYLMKSSDVGSGADVLTTIADITYSTGGAVPDQPSNVSATPASGEIDYAWDANSPTPSGYRVYAGDGTTLLYQGSSTSYARTGLTNGVTYSAYIAAYNGNGESTRKRVSATPGGAVPIRSNLVALYDLSLGNGNDGLGANNMSDVGTPVYSGGGLLLNDGSNGLAKISISAALRITGDMTVVIAGRVNGSASNGSLIAGLFNNSVGAIVNWYFYHGGATASPYLGINTAGGPQGNIFFGDFSPTNQDFVCVMRVASGVLKMDSTYNRGASPADVQVTSYASDATLIIGPGVCNKVLKILAVYNASKSDSDVTSIIADPTTLLNPPTLNAPSVSVSAHTTTTVTVTFSAGSGGSGANTFDAYKRVTGGGSYSLVASGVSSPYQYTGLTGGTSYDLEIIQSDDDPATPQSASASVTQSTDSTAGTATRSNTNSMNTFRMMNLIR